MYEEFKSGKIPYIHCSCGHNFFYPRDRCPKCHGSSLEVRISSGEGTVFSFTEFGQGVYAIIEMKEGFRLYANVRGKVKIGDKVRVIPGNGRPEFEKVEDK
ncbi:Zn-ribbon domain-containing OB-fold protein [Metallosphaera hakonensis]|uniref:DNA-binding protein n=1 Tax=Metallosphaera hakonensis JCM 8857 = DSM 7519 TaxID=1293036 RepID=A0A2U9IRD4_9CREN|nr:zinc ribbon domain-containing protein [Metallosphaera hakonensis]AWR98527.1 DNA-binding protein [Metallosphaera hakonensis JCM 8857 = DSM 7519]